MGPGVEALVSAFKPFDGVEEVSEAEDAGGGGGSITDAGAGDGLERGSGRAGIGSSAEDVSMVMFLVIGGDWRRA